MADYQKKEIRMSEWTPVATVYDPLKAGSIDGTDVEPHDRAVWRAMVARYVPNKAVVGDPQLTLFVARLNRQTTEEKLREVFSKYGDIRRLRLVRDVVTGFSRGYAFIEYKEERSLMKAHRDANKMLVEQHELFVDFEQERTLKGWVPRRLGGGLGGKKESGQLRFGGRDRPFRKPINLPLMSSDNRAPPQDRPRDRRWEKGGERDERHRDRDRDRDRDRSPDRDRDRDRDRVRERKEERERARERSDREWQKDKKGSKRERERSKERESRREKDEGRRRDKDRHKDRR